MPPAKRSTKKASKATKRTTAKSTKKVGAEEPDQGHEATWAPQRFDDRRGQVRAGGGPGSVTSRARLHGRAGDQQAEAWTQARPGSR